MLSRIIFLSKRLKHKHFFLPSKYKSEKNIVTSWPKVLAPQSLQTMSRRLQPDPGTPACGHPHLSPTTSSTHDPHPSYTELQTLEIIPKAVPLPLTIPLPTQKANTNSLKTSITCVFTSEPPSSHRVGP